MSLAEDIYLGQLVWADLTATQKRDAVYNQLAGGRSISEATDALSRIYGPIGANHVIGVINRHDLNDDEALREARQMRRADELRAVAARARAQKPVLLPKAETLPAIPKPKIGKGAKGRKVTLFDLKDRHCKRPLWDGDAVGLDEKFYCGAPVDAGRSSCAECAKSLYVAAEERRRKRPGKAFLLPGQGRYGRWK